jgi:hypothetical protein
MPKPSDQQLLELVQTLRSEREDELGLHAELQDFLLNQGRELEREAMDRKTAINTFYDAAIANLNRERDRQLVEATTMYSALISATRLLLDKTQRYTSKVGGDTVLTMLATPWEPDAEEVPKQISQVTQNTTST